MTTHLPGAEAGGAQGVPRCRIKGEGPCWRPAVRKFYPDDVEPSLCEEHRRCVELGWESDDWHFGLDALDKWIKGEVKEADSDHLEQLALGLRDELRAGYARAHLALKAAETVARQGPEEERRLTFEESEELIRLIERADAFANTRTLLEDVSEDELKVRDRWLIVDTLAAAVDAASEEVERYKREIGL